MLVPKGFLPTDDTGQLFGLTEGAQDISFESMAAKQAQLAEIIRRNPHVAGVMSFVGVGGSSQTLNNGRMVVSLKPANTRPRADAIARELRPQLAAVPGIRLFLQAPPVIRIGGVLTKAQYQYVLQDSDTARLYEWAPRLQAALRNLPQLMDVTSDLQISSPRVALQLDRGRAAALGVTASQIENALYSAYGQRQVGTIYTATNQYWVILEVAPEYRDSPAALGALYVRGSGGQTVPLAEVTRATDDVGAAGGHAFRPGAVGQPVVQPSARSIVEPGAEGDRHGRGEAAHAADDLDVVPGHGAGVPRFRRPVSACCSRSRCSSSTSCWACSTRATCTR